MIQLLKRFGIRLSVTLLLCGVLGLTMTAMAASSAQDMPKSEPTEATDAKAAGITEDALKQMLVGKTFYLRGRYLEGTLNFDEHGKIDGHSAQGSYTLCLIQIDKVHLTKHKVELAGIRYGLHFLGALPSEDPTGAMDRVRITPRKKLMRISIDREQVVKPKSAKKKKEQNQPAVPQNTFFAPNETGQAAGTDEEVSAQTTRASDTEQSAAPDGVIPTTSPAHARRVLEAALDRIFATSLDARMIDSMPGFWKLYYHAAAAQTDHAPGAPAVLRQNQVDQKAALLSAIEPPSNEYAQAAGVAGMALYHTVIGTDGKPQEIVVGRPIGFGLDENAADAIRKASFQPATKDGKPVPITLDIVVQFRIYSKRTSQTNLSEAPQTDSAPRLPGPYSVNRP